MKHVELRVCVDSPFGFKYKRPAVKLYVWWVCPSAPIPVQRYLLFSGIEVSHDQLDYPTAVYRVWKLERD